MSQSNQQHSLEEIRDIRQMMQRSSRFVSLSGLSGVAAGVSALVGVAIAYYLINDFYSHDRISLRDFTVLKMKLAIAAAIVFCVAFASSYYLTWRRARKQGLPVWDHASKRIAWTMIFTLGAGGIFIMGMLQYNIWLFVAPASLIFYGIALVSASRYTLSDIRYLGYSEVLLGLINTWYPGYGLWFWGAGFGVLHIIYGIVMWRKYERNES